MRTKHILRLMAAATLLAAGACGGGDDADEGATGNAAPEKKSVGSSPAEETTANKPSGKDAPLVVQVASYDMAAGRDQRVLLGLLADGGSALVSFGEVAASFAPATGAAGGPAVAPIQATGVFFPIGGDLSGADGTGPRQVEPSDGYGVYATTVRFPQAGEWKVTVDALVDGAARQAAGTFTVLARPFLPVPGDPAPRTENLLPGDPNAPAKAIDSRAGDDGAVPDPQLHSGTIAAALGAGKPLLVVVSTPVYCESRFCGPITDVVARLADRHGDAMAFVHLEVWRDFEKQVVNKAAADWILREGAGGFQEPWVFVVGSDGKVAERFDNVVAEPTLTAAVERVIG